MRVAPSACLLPALLLFASCRPPGAESAQSLVGANALPSSEALAREIIQINRGYGDSSEGFLSYELRPDGTLTVTHSDRARDRVIGEDRFRLADDVAGPARRALWRLRPAKLEGLDSHEARPTGCERRGPHDFGELAIIFIREAGRPGVEDDRIGTFELPDPRSCNSRQAIEARALVRRVLAALPRSGVAAGFRP